LTALLEDFLSIFSLLRKWTLTILQIWILKT